MVQVFLNILSNAEQAIQAAHGKGHIDISTTGLDHLVEITISDNGPGMPPEILNRVFEPFFTTKDIGQGTGLGLSVSHGIIKQHDGEIWADCVDGEGTTLHITIPIVEPAEEASVEEHNSASINPATRHLIVVDDEPHIRDFLKKALELERYTVDLAEDCTEAWRKLAIMDYDCVILDLKMPGMTGQELYHIIEKSSQSLAQKVVFITGDTVDKGVQAFASQAGNPIIMKPFRFAELLETVEAVCSTNRV